MGSRTGTKQISAKQKRALIILVMLTIAFAIRILTANFVAAHFNDSSWFQYGSYSILDRQAQAIIDGKQGWFWINDPSRTDLIQYPPGSPAWVAFLYRISGSRTPLVVQRVQLVLDSVFVVLVAGVAVTAFGWPTGIVTGFLAALSPAMAFSGATPSTDAPATWFVLSGVWMLLLSFKRNSVGWAIGAGIMTGIACWLRVNPFFLVPVWGVALALLAQTQLGHRAVLGAAVILATAITISPVMIRNLVVFYPEVVPNGLSIGVNLWQGIGDTSRGREFGAPASDAEMLDQDRCEMGLPADAPLQSFWPDGIRRDRERTRRSLSVIKSHPVWFTGQMLARMGGHLKFAGAPTPHVGTMGINVTPQKCLAPERQRGAAAVLVKVLGMTQSVFRYLELPLLLIGIIVAWRTNWKIALLLLTTILYYLFTMSLGHAEIRYGLPMQALFLVFAGLAIEQIIGLQKYFWQSRPPLRF